ncbi:MAG: RHS repeat-associated core domain-containing protein [Chloroflexota bacterium]
MKEKIFKLNPAVIWADTGMTVNPGQRLTVTATGKVNPHTQYDDEIFWVGPDGGYSLFGCGAMVGSLPQMMLLGKLGTSGSAFPIGKFYDNLEATGGRLYVAANDCPSWFGDNRGFFKLRIQVGAPGKPNHNSECSDGMANDGKDKSDNPIELDEGNKVLAFTDIGVQTPAGALTFERRYSQAMRNDVHYRFMGLGWSHSQIYKLNINSTVAQIFLSNGGVLKLDDIGTGLQFIARPGSTSVLDKSGSNYILTAQDKSVFTFEPSAITSGEYRLKLRTWPNGELWTYSYLPSSDNLSEIGDSYGRKLQFSYITSGSFDNGQLWRVGDQTASGLGTGIPSGRYVEFGYSQEKNGGVLVSGGKALLASVKDVRGYVWAYKYYGENVSETDSAQLNFLTKRLSPSVDVTGDGLADGAVTLEEVSYTLSGSTITNINQKRGNGLIETDFAFQPGGQNKTIETPKAGGTAIPAADTTHYFANGVYMGIGRYDGKDDLLNVQIVNDDYRPVVQVDGRGNQTNLAWGPNGKLLNGVTDASGHDTTFAYDTSDRLRANVDAEGRRALYLYDANNRQPTLILVENPNNLAVNGGMEADSDWSAISGAVPTTNERSTTQVESGSYSRRVVAGAANQGIEGVAWALVANRTYFITARVYVVTGQAKMKVTTTSAFDAVSGDFEAWETLRATYTPTVTSSGVKVQFVADGGSGEFFVDSVSISEIGADLAVNGSMELNSDWTAISGAAPTTNEQFSTQVDSGDHARHVVASAANQGIEGAAWDLVANQTYTITARVYPVSGIVKLQVPGIAAFDKTTTGTGKWETLSAVYSPPSVVTGKKLQFVASGAAAEFYVDSVSIVTTSQLVVNGSMEADSDWTNVGTPTINQRSSTQADSGSYSRRVVASAAGQGIEGNTWNLVANQAYTIRARVFPISGTVKMQVPGITAFDVSSSEPGSWQTLSAVYTPSSDITGKKLQFVSSGGAAEFYVDNVSINLTRDLATNGDMELDSNWTLVGTPTTNARRPRVDSGSYVRHVVASAANQGIEGAAWDLVVNRTYLVMARVYSISGVAKLQVPGITAFDKTTTGTGAWETLRAVYKATSGATGKKLQFVASGSAAEFYVDTVHIIDLGILPGNIEDTVTWHEFAYDTRGRLLEDVSVNPKDLTPIQQIQRSYYASGEGSGLLKQTVQKDVGGSNPITNIYTYDSAGRVIKTLQKKAFGDCCATLTEYDTAGNVITTTSVTDLTLTNDPTASSVTAYAYDALGRKIRTTVNSRTAFYRTTLTFYDAMSRVVRTIDGYTNQSSGAAEEPALWVWSDVRARWEKSASNTTPISHGSDNTQNVITDTLYNARGFIRLQRDPLGNVTLYGYDTAGQLVKTIQSASRKDYNNDYTGSTPNPFDPDLSDYGTVSYPLSAAPDQDMVTTQRYDTAGNRVQIVDAVGNITYIGYDALNRQIRTVRNAKDTATIDIHDGDAKLYNPANDPASFGYAPISDGDRDLIRTTEYDAVGRLFRQADEMGRILYTAYDLQGRVSRDITNYVSQGTTDPKDWYWYEAAQQWQRSSIDTTAIVHGAANDQNIVTLTVYDNNSRVLYTQDILGRRTWFKYDGLGRVVKTVANAVGTATDNGINDPRSASYVVSSNSDKDRISITTYDGNARVQWTQDPLGRKNWNVYDTQGRVVKTIQNCTYISGSPAPEDPTYVGSGNPDDDRISRMEYDSQGRVFKVTDPASVETRYEYDILGRRTKTIASYQDGVYDPLNPDKDLIQTMSYDQLGRVVSTADARGTQTASTYDRLGRHLTVTQAANNPLASVSYVCYDKMGRVRRAIQNWSNDPNKPAPDGQDVNGNWLFVPEHNGAYNDHDLITLYEYDRAGRMTKPTNAVGDFSMTSYFKDGQVQFATDPEGTITQNRYDGLGRRNRVVQGYVANGEDPGLWIWNTGWKKSDGTTAIQHTDGITTNEDRNVIVDVTYDKVGRAISFRNPRGVVTTNAYDQLNRRTQRIMNYVDGIFNAGSPTEDVIRTVSYTNPAAGKSRAALTDPNGITTQRDFDRLGRLASIAYGNPANTADVVFSYDNAGNRMKMSEYSAAGFTSRIRETTYGFDAVHRMTSVGFDSNGDGAVDDTVSYAYDAGGLRTKLTMPGSLNITYTYDQRGQLVSLTDWDSQKTQFAYDLSGRHIATESANGLRSRYEHDAAGRLKRLRHTKDFRTLAHFEYETDKRGNRVQALEALAYAPTTTDTIIAYNDKGLSLSGIWSEVSGFKESSQFNASLKMIFLGDEATLTMGIGPDHGIYDIYLGGSLWQSFDGYAASASQRDIVISLGVDSRKLQGEGPHLVEIRNRAEKNKTSTGYKVRFNQLLVVDRIWTLQTIRHSYDKLSRLLEARYAPGANAAAVDTDLLRRHLYSYDRAGNRLSQSTALNGGSPFGTNYTYNALNQLTSGSAIYDNNGNLTNDGTTTYTWDRANRLMTSTFFGNVINYAYDGVNNRVQTTENSNVTKYLLDLQPGLAMVLAQQTGSFTQRNVFGPRGIHARKGNVGWNWSLLDGLGSVRREVNGSLTVDSIQDYDPYGVTITGGVADSMPVIYNFAGEPRDNHNLLYLRARYFNPTIGVFTALDPFEGAWDDPMSLNGYNYVHGNPVNWTDPSGKIGLELVLALAACPECVIVGIVGAAVILGTLFILNQLNNADNSRSLGQTIADGAENLWNNVCVPAIKSVAEVLGQSASSSFGSQMSQVAHDSQLENDRRLVNLRARARDYVDEHKMDESQDCLGGMSPPVAADYFALVAQMYWAAGSISAGKNAPMAVAVTRGRDEGTGKCREFVAVSNELSSRKFDELKVVYDLALPGIKWLASGRSLLPFANTSVPILGGVPQKGGGSTGHAEQLLYQRISPMRAMGVSRELCDGCKDFFAAQPSFPISYWIRPLESEYDDGGPKSWP